MYVLCIPILNIREDMEREGGRLCVCVCETQERERERLCMCGAQGLLLLVINAL